MNDYCAMHKAARAW